MCGEVGAAALYFEDATIGEDVADLWAELDGLDIEVSDWITTGVKEI